MFNFNGGTTLSGSSLTPLGMYAGYLLMNSGNFWVAACFLAVTTLYFLIVVSTLTRFYLNYHRNKHLFTATAGSRAS